VSTFNIISTEIWRILLPTGWTQRESTKKGSIYFESKDGKKGAYFSTLRVPKEGHTPKEELESVRATEILALHRMENTKWEIVDKWYSENPRFCILGADAFDQERKYRIVSQLLAATPWIVRSSLHDYDCSDYAKSKEAFRPILESFQTNELEA
jgi:hypothetical protein